MSTQKNAIEDEALEEGLMHDAYRTKDFEFVVACMSMSDITVKVVQLVPVEQVQGKMDHVEMCLSIFRNGHPVESAAEFEKLRIRYQNNELLVNPRSQFENGRVLRSMINDTLNRWRKNRDRLARFKEQQARAGSGPADSDSRGNQAGVDTHLQTSRVPGAAERGDQ